MGRLAQLILKDPKVRTLLDAERAKAVADLRMATAEMEEYNRAVDRLITRMVISGHWILR